MARSRLISPFIFVISRVDTTATGQAVPGTGFGSGYDPILRRVRSVGTDVEQFGDSANVYLPAIEIRGQVEEKVVQRARGRGVDGETEDGRLEVTCLTEDLVQLGLVADGQVLLTRGDRLDEVKREDGTTEVDVLSGFGRPLYVVSAELDGYGGLRTSNPRVGLVDVVFATRMTTR